MKSVQVRVIATAFTLITLWFLVARRTSSPECPDSNSNPSPPLPRLTRLALPAVPPLALLSLPPSLCPAPPLLPRNVSHLPCPLPSPTAIKLFSWRDPGQACAFAQRSLLTPHCSGWALRLEHPLAPSLAPASSINIRQRSAWRLSSAFSSSRSLHLLKLFMTYSSGGYLVLSFGPCHLVATLLDFKLL